MAKQRKLYHVEITIEMMVVGSSEAEARLTAEDALSDEVASISPEDFWVKPARSIAEGWDTDSYPWGSTDEESDRTVGDWLKLDGQKTSLVEDGVNNYETDDGEPWDEYYDDHDEDDE